MPHVTFVHGISNKPTPDKLLENWNAELDIGGLNLATQGITSSMVYWADVVYEKPLKSSSNFESVDDALGTEGDDADLQWVYSLSGDQRAVVDALVKKLELDKTPPDNDREAMPSVRMDENSDYDFEAIPLPWFIKERVMKRFLKDVHHYLFNERFSPRVGETYDVQNELRKRFVEQLEHDKANATGPFVIVAHSMGTVISYDCLKNVPGCPTVDGLITAGSPLGLSEIHDNFKPNYNKKDAYPSSNIARQWVNIYDRLDPVAFDARLSNDYCKAGQDVVKDEKVINAGVWRHSSHKYFHQDKLVSHLRSLLSL